MSASPIATGTLETPQNETIDERSAWRPDIRREVAAVLLCAIMLGGVAIRLHGLTASGITHPEVYVPGIVLPAGIAEPSQRFTITEVWKGTVLADVHPPGFYLLMLPWTRWFGTSIGTIRLPSVLFGAVSIALVFAIGWLAEGRMAIALVASLLIAFNGLHIFWSQEARMYSMACALALLSTMLLMLLAKNVSRVRSVGVLYVLVTLAALGTVVYVWPIFVTTMMWTAVRRESQQKTMPALFRWQLLVLILAMPLLALAAFQSRRSSYLGDDLASGAALFLQFGFLLERDQFAPFLDQPSRLAEAVVTAFAICLIAAGVLLKTPEKATRMRDTEAAPPFSILMIAGVLSSGIIVMFARWVAAWDGRRNVLIAACAALALLLPLASPFLSRRWIWLRPVWAVLERLRLQPRGLASLDTALALVPASLVVMASLAVPLLASRGFLVFVPFLLLLTARGCLRIAAVRPRSASLLVVGLLVIAATGVYRYKHRMHTPRDYRALASMLSERLRPSDLVFVQRDWVTTPLYYHLDATRTHLVAAGYGAAIVQFPGSRVWVVSFKGVPASAAVDASLKDLAAAEWIVALRAKAVLYERRGDTPTPR